MAHASIPLQTPIEIIRLEPLDYSPLISKCQIKVCWVSDEPNRNGSVITKAVAQQMAPSLRGSPIVGYYDENKKDFDGHNEILEFKGNEIVIKSTTRPYGFVDLTANVWFQKFLDDDAVEREYLVTEGYLWTGQYPECQRVIDRGNPHSMELDNAHTDGVWTEFGNEGLEFFIINETIISKLCILGEDVEPCFEGSNITKTQFSFNTDSMQQIYNFMKEIKEILSKGGKQPMYNLYTVEVGDNVWTNIYSYLVNNYPAEEPFKSQYSIEGVYEEEGQLFFVCASENKYLRFNFKLENEEFSVESPVDCAEDFKPQENPQFSVDSVNSFIEKYTKENTLKTIEEAEVTVEYSIYQDALNRINELETLYSNKTNEVKNLNATIESLNSELNTLREFKNNIDHKEKQDMIDSFYMLSEEDKKDVTENIDNYSLDDIESKLSVICVRNKVNFNQEDPQLNSTTFTLEEPVDDTPDWIKAVLNTEKELNKF